MGVEFNPSMIAGSVLDGQMLFALLLGLPVFGAFLSCLCGAPFSLIKKDISGIVASLASCSTFFVSLVICYKVCGSFSETVEKSVVILEWLPFAWIDLPEFLINATLRADTLSAVMLLVVTGVGSLIHLFSVGYMAGDEARHRYFAFLNLFLAAMILLVLGGNLAVLFMGWEGVGFCSYLLIGFWSKELNNAIAARKAFIVNRIGDVGFLLGMFLLLKQFRTLDFFQLREAVANSPFVSPVYWQVVICFLVAAAAKSAQFPLYVWLPDAMVGPTPVSALIHAATMVTAGIYLFIRLYFLVDLVPSVGLFLSIVAGVTALGASLIALVQTDIKRVLAYSTVSQLGIMFFAIGAGAYVFALFHLVTHAFFKAGLFLGAGSVIHGCNGEQDMRRMGGLRKSMPITFVTFVLGSLALSGIFPFAGYFSKHAIVQSFTSSSNPLILQSGSVFIWLTKIIGMLTAFYTGRMVFLTFCGSYRGRENSDPTVTKSPTSSSNVQEPHESPLIMTFPLVVLGLLSVVGGIIGAVYLPTFISSSIPVSVHVSAQGGWINYLFECFIGSLSGVIGITFSAVCYLWYPQVLNVLLKFFKPLLFILRGKLFIDEFYYVLIVLPLRGIAFVCSKVVEVVFIDGVVEGIGSSVEMAGEVSRLSQSGQVRHYVLLTFFCSVGLLVFYFLI
jgi:NADH-quinone oxidoreductase subunit L